MELAEILSLLQAVRDTGVAELELAQGDFKLTIRQQLVSAAVAPAPLPVASAMAPVPATPAPATASTPEAEPPKPKPKALTVNSPMVGTFYRSPAPESPPFVEIGEVVKVGQTVCIIEAMKLMNELESEASGRVVRFLVENGDAVEYGQPLLELEPV